MTTVSPADLRSRLYEAYATERAGRGDGEAAALVYRRDIRPLLPSPAAGPVVDLGCGRGELVRLMQLDGFDAEGIDISPEQAALTRAAGVPRVCQGADLHATRKETRVTVKDLIRPLPGVRRLSLLRQRVGFRGSAVYWEQRYARGGTSGVGSYRAQAEVKAAFLNDFVYTRGVGPVIEFGCGDGNQLSLADYSRYIGLDVSRSAIALCQRRFADDPTKSFFLYDGACFTDHVGLFTADLAISLDVIYHLTEDAVFEAYMTHLFAAGAKYVIVYAPNREIRGTAPHVRHRHFTSWVAAHCPGWRLLEVMQGARSSPDRPHFFTYERVTTQDDSR